MTSPQQEAQAIINQFNAVVNDKPTAIKLAIHQLDYTLKAMSITSADISYERDYFVEVKRAIEGEILVDEMKRIDSLADELHFLVTKNNSGWDLKLIALDFTLNEYHRFRDLEKNNK